MKTQFNSLSLAYVALALVLSSIACTPKSDSPKAAGPGPSTTDTSATDEAKKIAESVRDISSGGGQPGTVSILGPLSNEINYQESHISVDQSPGQSWRGRSAKLDENSLVKAKDLTESKLKEITEAKALKTIVYVGCEDFVGTTSILPPGNLEPVTFQIVPSDAVTMIKANTVFICSQANFPNRFTVIVAAKVYLNGLRLELTGGPGNGLSITTSDLLLSSLNYITTQAPNGPTTVLAGPSVSIAAVRIGDTHGGESTVSQGDRLEIKTLGADYQEKEKP
ncbi:MAG: hypothetical protein H7061_11405 [Bdellovibrionaceae bacterium]|nr:hypothetical protein [Bdellovibrio sp.]